MRHTWALDSEGEVDMWHLSYGYHNGPHCTTCLESWCVNCSPNILDRDNCPGDT